MSGNESQVHIGKQSYMNVCNGLKKKTATQNNNRKSMGTFTTVNKNKTQTPFEFQTNGPFQEILRTLPD